MMHSTPHDQCTCSLGTEPVTLVLLARSFTSWATRQLWSPCLFLTIAYDRAGGEVNPYVLCVAQRTPWEQRRDIAQHLSQANITLVRVCGRIFACAVVDVCLCTLLFVRLCGLTAMPARCFLSSVQLESFTTASIRGNSHHLCVSPRELLNHCFFITEHQQPEQSTFVLTSDFLIKVERFLQSTLCFNTGEWLDGGH